MIEWTSWPLLNGTLALAYDRRVHFSHRWGDYGQPSMLTVTNYDNSDEVD